MLTEWFDTNCGVKQGDTLSPTIFGIFINDTVDDVKSVNIGINIDGINVCILFYADDIVLLSETEEGLQKLLDKVYMNGVENGKSSLTLPYLTPPPFLFPNECDILFIMYFVIAPNANKMRIHNEQLIISKRMCVVYFESWPCRIDC